MCCNLFLSFIYFKNWNLLILLTLDKIRRSPSRSLRKTRGLVVMVNQSFGNYFYGGNSSTICKRIFLTFSTNTRKLPNLYIWFTIIIILVWKYNVLVNDILRLHFNPGDKFVELSFKSDLKTTSLRLEWHFPSVSLLWCILYYVVFFIISHPPNNGIWFILNS